MTAGYQAGLLLVIGLSNGLLASALWHIRLLHKEVERARRREQLSVLLADTRANEALDRLMTLTAPGAVSELRHWRPAQIPVVAPHPEEGFGRYQDPEDEEIAGHDATGLVYDFG